MEKHQTGKIFTLLNSLAIREYKQTSFVIWGNQLIFFVGLFYFFPYAFIAVPSMYMMGFFWEAGLHRYFAHNSYQTGPIGHRILFAISFIVGQGSILSWCNVHRHHHRWADTERDPHSPYYVHWLRICSSLFPNKCEANYVKNLLRTEEKSYLLFENRYYWLMWTAFWLIMFAIHPLLLFFIASGSALWWWSVVFVNIFSHRKLLGKCPEERGIGTNSFVINLITGMGHHYNHHRDPANYTDRRTNEIFVYGLLIKLLFMKKLNNS